MWWAVFRRSERAESGQFLLVKIKNEFFRYEIAPASVNQVSIRVGQGPIRVSQGSTTREQPKTAYQSIKAFAQSSPVQLFKVYI